MTHMLKVWPQYFNPLARNEKSFEIRKNDRDYSIGDTLWLREWCPEKEKYTGREIKKEVQYIAEKLSAFGIPDDIVVMAVK